MSIHQDLRSRLVGALKKRDQRTADLIRMINSKITERTKAKGFTGEIDDALVLDVIAAYSKSMKKAREEYVRAGPRGAEQVAQLDFEVEWCATFLPAQLSEAEVRTAVAAAIAEVGAEDPKMAGRVVGVVMKQHKGLVDAALVKRIATALLTPSEEA